MRKSYRKAVVISLLLMAFAVSGIAQSRTPSRDASKFLVSARAGGVSFVEGSATSQLIDGRVVTLRKGQNVEIGDRVRTGPNGRAEILLNPGSYIRIGPNSVFEFESTDLDDLRVEVFAGSAMFEVFATNEFSVSVSTRRGDAKLIETGIYRIDVDANGVGELFVIEGRASVGSNLIVKGGRTAVMDDRTASATKFNKKDRDELAEWSRIRGKEQAKQTSTLKDRALRDSLLGAYNAGGWNMYSSFGLWVFDPFRSCYSFLPFGRSWYSPYGVNYGLSLYWFNLPHRINRDLPPFTAGTNNPTTGGIKTIRNNPKLNEPPPYTRIERVRQPAQVFGDFGSPNLFPPNTGGIRTAPSIPPVSTPPIASPTRVGSAKEQP